MRSITVLFLVFTAACAGSKIRPVGTDRPQSVYITDGSGRTTSVTTTVRNTVDEALFAVPAADVWRVLPTVYDSLDLEINELDTRARLIGNSGVKLRRQLGGTRLSRYFDCGSTRGSNNADTYELHLSLITQAHEFGPAGTRLSMAVQAQAKPMSVSGEWVRCSVTGALQARIVDWIDAHLKG